MTSQTFAVSEPAEVSFCGRPSGQRQPQKPGEAAGGCLVTQKALLTFRNPVGVNHLAQVALCHDRLAHFPAAYAPTNLAAFSHALVRQLAQVGAFDTGHDVVSRDVAENPVDAAIGRDGGLAVSDQGDKFFVRVRLVLACLP